MLLYGRKTVIAVGTRNGDGREVQNLRCSFDIHKNTKAELNKAEISIYNLSLETYELLANSPIPQVQVDAGYEDNCKRIFVGDVKLFSRERSGLDTITKITAFDGFYIRNNSVINKSYPPNTTINTIVSDIEQAMINAGFAAFKKQFSKAVGARKIKNGLTVKNKALNVLNDILSPHGYRLYVNNNAIIIAPSNTVFNTTGFVLSEQTGLIGSPTIDLEGNNSNALRIVKAKALLNPSIDIGSQIKLVSRSLNSNYVVKSIRYNGDTHADNWHMELELI